ncbi:glycosyltransferase family 87 protein [Erythrobacter sp. WG]|uniref:glycosyltransferase family 87 protein n=1 Tax=Erythrobacter sp. WG TaxID=2985510 RepID=UPI00226DD8B1|nr:glycosyltransferase family 87 protein [Erythrobacter sp. WG]MCX9146069.1 DUF2029 domain-containing protein [Erythrobacter sp. WG]
MSRTGPSVAEAIGRSRLLLACYLVVAVLLVAISAVRFQSPEQFGLVKELTDFDAFHIAGRLAGEGRVADAYDAAAMLKVQAEASPIASFMPWTYPPPFTLLMDSLARLPVGAAYALFALASFGFYLAVLRRIAGEWLLPVLIALLPIVMLNLRTGQNGFLVAGLIGAFLLAWRDRRAVAGLPLGLLVIKPHLAVGVGLLALFGRRWDVVGIAAAVVLAAAGAATLAYGVGVWADFLGAVREAGAFLAGGYYPMYRMTSAYAALLTFGVPAEAAMIGHAAIALAAVLALAWAALARLGFAARAALICTLSLFVSPYSYDYDLAILGIALAFVLPDLAARTSGRALAGLLALAWATGGYGMIVNAMQPEAGAAGQAGAGGGLALAGLLLVTLCVATGWLLHRPRAGASDALAPQGA